MAKKRKKQSMTRDAPSSNTGVMYCSADTFKALLDGNFVPLSQCPEVRMCVDVYADLISNMTLYLMQNTDKGDIRVRNALSRKLDVEPNRLMTKKSFFFALVRNLMLDGDGNQVVYPTYSRDGRLENLELFSPSDVSFRDTAEAYEIWYKGQRYQPDEVLHFRINPDPDRPWIGTGYRAALRDVVRGIRQANATKQKLMENPAPSLVVKVDGLDKDLQDKETRRELSNQYLDETENGRPWFIASELFDVQSVAPLTLNDLALPKNMEIDKRTIAGIFRIPPFLVGVGEFNKSQFNNFISTGIMSIAKVIEQELTRGLLISPEMYWKWNQRSLYSYDLGEIIEAGKQMVDRMAMRRNEWRDWIGIPPDPEMEELLALENYIPAARLGDQKKLKGGEENEQNGNTDALQDGAVSNSGD